MLAVDIAGSSDQELQREIAERCAPYGSVVRVRVHVRRFNSQSRPCAIVDMTNAQQATQVAEAFAASLIGRSVVILLERAARPAHRAATNEAMPDARPRSMFQLLVKHEGEARRR